MRPTYTELLEENELLKIENANLKVDLIAYDELKKAYKEIGEVNQKLLKKIEKLKGK